MIHRMLAIVLLFFIFMPGCQSPQDSSPAESTKISKTDPELELKITRAELREEICKILLDVLEGVEKDAAARRLRTGDVERIAARAVQPKLPPRSERRPELMPAASTETEAKEHFWHGAYQAAPHDPNCRDEKWHPYLKAEPGAGGDPEKYRLVDSLPEEIDVSGYPEKYRAIYHNVIRTYCASCHTPARCLNQHYTPKQWESALAILRNRYKDKGLTEEITDGAYDFFMFYEEEVIRQEEEPDLRVVAAPEVKPEAGEDPNVPPDDTGPQPEPSQPAAKKHFWHGTYHEVAHDPDCRDEKWHPYLKAEPGAGGDLEKYRLIDSLPEEIDVSLYPGEYQDIYHNIVRTYCASCHTPARGLNQHYTPKQWKSAISILQRRYGEDNLTDEMKEKVYDFFIFYEKQVLTTEEEEDW